MIDFTSEHVNKPPQMILNEIIDVLSISKGPFPVHIGKVRDTHTKDFFVILFGDPKPY